MPMAANCSPLLLKRDFGALARCALVSAALMLLWPLCALGGAATVRFYTGALAQIVRAGHTTMFAHYGPNVVSLALTGTVDDRSPLFLLLQAAALGLVAANVALLHRLVRMRVAHEPYWSAALLFTTLPFLVRTSWLHSFAWLPLAQAFVVVLALHDHRRASRTALLLAPVIASALLRYWWHRLELLLRALKAVGSR